MNSVACTKSGPAPRASAPGGDCTFRVSDDTRDDKWDRFLAELPVGHHTQTSLWSQVKASRGWRATRADLPQRHPGLDPLLILAAEVEVGR